MSDPQYVDENGNPVDPSEIEGYEVVAEPAPAPTGPASRPAPSVGAPEPGGGGSTAKVTVAVVATAGLVLGGGFGAFKAGWIDPGAATTAAPSASATATATSSAPSASASTSASPSSSAPSSTTMSSTPTVVSNSRYTGAKWSSAAVKPPSLRMRVTDSLELPGSTLALWNGAAAKAFNKFSPWVTVAVTAPNTLTVQTVSRSQVTKSWAEAVVDISGKPRIVGENSGDNVDGSAALADSDGSPAADTGPDDGGAVTYRVEGEGVPTTARGKRPNSVKLSAVKRDGHDQGVLWVVAGGTLLRVVLEDLHGGSEAAAEGAGPSTEAEDTEGN